MGHREGYNNGFLSLIRFWPIIAAIGMGLIFYGTISTKVETNTLMNREQSHKLDTHETRISRMEQAVIEIPQMRGDIQKILQLVGGSKRDR